MTGVWTIGIMWEPTPYRWLALVCLGLAAAVSLWQWLECLKWSQRLPTITFMMRLALLLALGVLLASPSDSTYHAIQAHRPDLYLLVDTSGSMGTRDIEHESRIECVRRIWLNPKLLDKLNDLAQVRCITFADQIRDTPPSGFPTTEIVTEDNHDSYILAAVREALNRLIDNGSQVGAGIVLISDGRDTSGDLYEQVINQARANNLPVHTVVLGGIAPSMDLALNAEPIPPVLYPGESGTIAVTVSGQQGSAESIEVYMKHQGVEHRYDAIPQTHNIARVDIPINETIPGLHEYHLRIRARQYESNLDNNRQTVFVRVNQEPIRVLLIEEQPTWDTRLLSRALQDDTLTELTRFTRLSETRSQVMTESARSDIGLPLSALEDLVRFDVIVIGGGTIDTFNSDTLELLVNYTRQEGGSVMFLDHTSSQTGQWRRLIPSIKSEGWISGDGLYADPGWPTQIRIPVRGDLLSSTNQSESKHESRLRIRQVDRLNPAAKVLAWSTTPDSKRTPTVIGMPIGQGKVAEVLCSGLWRYAMRPRDHATAMEVDRLWVELIRWIKSGSVYTPTGPVSLWLSSVNQNVGEPIRINLSARHPYNSSQLSLTLDQPDGEAVSIQPERVPGSTTRWRAFFTPQIPGVYRVTAKDPNTEAILDETRFSCFRDDRESVNVSANHALMKTLADSTGGVYIPDNNPDRLLDALGDSLEITGSAQQPSHSRLPAWADGWLLITLLTWAGAEWIIRSLGQLE